jgi:predicted Zn-dependent peptidase
MFFKGTNKHTYKEINRITAELGDANAYTSKETTAFFINSLAFNFERSADMLMEMFFEPAFIEEEFEIEKGVIVEEYQSRMDDPMIFFWNMVNESFWGSQRGHKTVGNRNTITNMTIDDLKSFRKRYYNVDNIAFAVTGNIDESEVVRVFERLLSDAPSSSYVKLDSSAISYDDINFEDFEFNHKAKQAIIGFIAKGVSAKEKHDKNYRTSVMSVGLGGGMHSLLFDRIREELGLCYHVGIWTSSYKDTGDMLVHCLLDEGNIQQAKDEIQIILKKIKSEGLDDELIRVSKSTMLFDLAEDVDTSRGYSQLIFDNYFKYGCELIDCDDRKDRIDSVTNDDIIEAANDAFKDDKLKFVQMTTEK